MNKSVMSEEALPINSMIDGDSHRLANALRSINATLTGRQIPADKVSELAQTLEKLASEFAAIEAPGRARGFGVAKDDDSAAGSGFDYGSGNSLSYRPISGNCNALAAPANYFKCRDEQGQAFLKGKVTFGAAFEGPPKLVHGGYIAAYMDEVFGIALSHSDLYEPAMTGTLKTIYRMPVPLDTELTYEARVTGTERRKVFMHCTLKDAAGTLYAEGEAIFLKIDPAVYALMGG
jgi:acyl-coenzyme A thioesterase PaaI-like protein